MSDRRRRNKRQIGTRAAQKSRSVAVNKKANWDVGGVHVEMAGCQQKANWDVGGANGHPSGGTMSGFSRGFQRFHTRFDRTKCKKVVFTSARMMKMCLFKKMRGFEANDLQKAGHKWPKK